MPPFATLWESGKLGDESDEGVYLIPARRRSAASTLSIFTDVLARRASFDDPPKTNVSCFLCLLVTYNSSCTKALEAL
jgi:hypothetical protein